MASRTPSLDNRADVGIAREIGSKYDVILAVKNKLAEIELVAGFDIDALIAELEAAQDFTGITVVQGPEVTWDPIGKILTIPKGDTGAQGEQGIAGPTGAVGPKGDALTIVTITNPSSGLFVWTFSDGTVYNTPDLVGPQGPIGLTGPQGIQGVQGPQGIQGETGLQGPIGLTGDTGPQGPQGLKGDTGDVGPQGIQGIQGIKGDTGDTVDHASRTVGTGAAGTTDTYTLWGDVAETVNMGTFDVYNGANGTGAMQSIIAGTNISIDNTDPSNPVISATASSTVAVLDDLDDVVLTTSATGDVLRYNGTEWVNSSGLTDAETAIGNVYTKTEVQTVLPKVGFDTTNAVVPSAGQMAWNIDEGTLDLGLMDAVLQVGQEFLVKVRNASGGVITNGTVVMASGSIGNSGRITVVPHDGTQANATRAIGVLTQTLADGVDGFATIIGKVRDINTTGSSVSETWVDGDVLYIKPNDNGNLTKIAPIDTEISMKVAMVVHAHTAGTLYIRVVGFDENHYKAWVQTRLDGKVNRPTSTTHKLVKFTGVDGSIGDSNLVSNSMGDLGLNVSPSLWHTSVRALETAAGALFHYGSTKISWIQNAYQGLDGIFRYKSNAPATIITQDSGDIVFSTAPSGAAEASVTFTEKMKLSNDGVLTVGGTEVQSKLVSGTDIKTVNGTSILGSGNIDISAGAVLDKHVFVATAGQTEFTVAYTVGLLEVYRNGLKLTSELYVATNGTSVTLVDACVVDDVVEVIGYSSFDVMNTYTIAQTDALIATKQDVLISGIGIKTVNGESVLGTGDISVQPTLVSGTSIKTVNGSTLLGSGDISTADSSKLNLSGGTMTGAITSLRETSVSMATNNIDLAAGNLFTKTISGATTLTISNALASGNVNSFVLELTNAGSATITWFSGVKWAGGTAPTLTASGKDILSFYSIDGGTTWNVLGIQKDVK